MAGREADKEFCGPSDDYADGADIVSIDEMLRSCEFNIRSKAALHDYERRLRIWARALVRRHRPTIERLADELLLRGKLTGREADRFVAKLYRPKVRRMTSELDRQIARLRRGR